MGAGLGGRFENTMKLHSMNYKAAMKSTDKPKWDQAVEEEHDRMIKMGVWVCGRQSLEIRCPKMPR